MKTILMKFFSSTLLLFFTFFTFSQDINWMEFEKFKKSETKKFIGTGYTLIGKINAFNMGDKKVTGGQFSFSTYLNE